MEKTVMDIRKALIEMPLNSITYLEIPEEDGNWLELDRVKLMALMYRAWVLVYSSTISCQVMLLSSGCPNSRM